MRGAIVAAGLLLATLAALLGWRAPRGAVAAAGSAGAAALLLYLLRPTMPADWALGLVWASLIVTAAAVYLPRLARMPGPALVVLATSDGAWAGLAATVEGGGGPGPIAAVLATLLLAIPARLAVRRGWTIAVRVVVSWLLAVALLVGAVPYLVAHPGYEPDHRL